MYLLVYDHDDNQDFINKVQNEIQRCFITVQDSEEIEIILLKKIIRKCIKIVIDSDIYLTYCVDSEEHD